jgi:hypothetical protein
MVGAKLVISYSEMTLVVYRIKYYEFVVSTEVLKNPGLKSLLRTYSSLVTNAIDH